MDQKIQRSEAGGPEGDAEEVCPRRVRGKSCRCGEPRSRAIFPREQTISCPDSCRAASPEFLGHLRADVTAPVVLQLPSGEEGAASTSPNERFPGQRGDAAAAAAALHQVEQAQTSPSPGD